MRKIPLHFKIILGLLLGVVYAFLSSAFGWNEFTINWIDPFGTIFIRLLKLIAIPLVLFSIISGISDFGDISSLGRLGAKTIGLYFLTTFIAVTIGLVLVNVIQPGVHIDKNQRIKNRISYEKWVEETEGIQIKDKKHFLLDPQYAHLLDEEKEHLENNKVEKLKGSLQKNNNEPTLQFLVDMVPENLFTSLSNNRLMLQIIFFAIFFGVSISLLDRSQTEPITVFVKAANNIFLKMIELIMRLAPYFVFALLAGVIAKMADSPAEVWEIFKGLGSYSITLLLGLAMMVFVVYPFLTTRYAKKLSYRDFFKKMREAQIMAFSTSSSAATLPVTMKCVEGNLKVPRKITSFVLPIGATVNMDGTSLLLSVAVVFMAQLHLVDLSFGQQMMIVFTSTLASIGTAAVPSAGLVMMIIVLQSVGLNPAWIAIIFPVDRILDMCRTVVNVTGDATVATMVAASENELPHSA